MVNSHAMKVVNIPSTKMMKKVVRICARSSLHRLRVPIHSIVLKRSVVIASAAKQSIARHNGCMDCFAALAMTRRVPGVIGQRDLRSALAVPAFVRRIISSSFSLTGYLPFLSRACLPTLLMRSAKIARSLACHTQATPINSPAT